MRTKNFTTIAMTILTTTFIEAVTTITNIYKKYITKKINDETEIIYQLRSVTFCEPIRRVTSTFNS